MFLSFCDNIIKFSVLYEPNYVSDMNSTYPTFIWNHAVEILCAKKTFHVPRQNIC